MVYLAHDTEIIIRNGTPNILGRMKLTTLDDTAPFMLPKLITIASETLRLYVPSTLFDTHAMTFGIVE